MTFERTMDYFSNAQKRDPTLRAIAKEDFSLFCMQQSGLEREQNRPPLGTAQELWNAVCAWEPDPMNSPPAAAPIPRIHELLRRESFGRVPLGMLQLRDFACMCALEPTLCLPPDEDAYSPMIPTNPPLTKAHSVQNAVRAIKYADSHPSEASIHMASARDKKAGANTAPRLATDDDILRRFMPLGYISMKIRGEWVKTGHTLVIDASYGRKCHPWFVLAADFETYDEEYFFKHGSYTVEVPKTVSLHDHDAIGVLPGNSNRTTIAKLEHCDDTRRRNEKFVSHFGENFKFQFKRMGQDASHVRLQRGPDRVHITDWWWDPKDEVEVCFTPIGRPYIRYNPKVRRYDGPKDDLLDEMGNILGIAPRAEGFQSRGLTMPPGPSGSGSGRDRGQGYGPAYGHGQRESSAWTAEA